MNKLFTKIAGVTLGFAMAIGVGVAVAGKQDVKAAKAEEVTYKLTIDASDFNTTSYAANNNEKTSNAVCTTDNTKTYEVKWTSNQIMKNSNNMQWQKSKGYLYNSTDLGTITDVTITSSAGTFTTYYGTSEQPSSGTTVGNGFFQIKVGSATGTASKVEVTFKIEEGGSTTTLTVTYASNGATSGDVPVDSNTYESGDKATVLGNTGNLAKDGYTFVGWTYNNKTYQAGDQIEVTTPVTLSAKWYKNDSISVVSGKENNSIYTGATLLLSTCVEADGDGELSFVVPENDYYTYDAENLTLTADDTKTGGPATITAQKGSQSAQFTVTVIERPASGVFEKFSGDIEEGDYLITYNDGAMKAQISSDRFNYDAVVPENDTITNPDALLIWHIAQEGSYWTLYNEETGKYAGSNAKNKGALLDSVVDNSKWTVTGDTTYDFENYGRSTGADSGNKWLRRNTTYGFACYASGTGGALTLYKLASDVTKYEVIDRVDDGSLDKTQVTEGATLNATIIPDEGYGLPESVEVMMAGSPVAFTYENGVVTVQNVQGNVTIEGACVKINPIQYLYTKASSASVDVYGYYVGFLDGTGPVIMDGEYGIVIYNKTAAVSGYVEGETILHVTGSITIFNGLYEIGSSTIAVASGTYPAPAAPVVYTAQGGETAEYASRLTTVTGVGTVTKGNFDGDAGAVDITMNFAVGSNTVQVYYKKAAQTADTEAYAAIKTAVANQTEITVKGFTGWYNGFQVQMNGVVAAVDTYTAEDFSQDLLDQTDAICVNYVDGKSSYDEFKALLTAVWSDLASNDKYPSLPSEQKAILADAERVESGTVVEQAMARYDYLTGKYELNNFINGRTPMANFRGNLSMQENNDVATIVVIIAIASISAFGCLLILKKRKHQ